MARGVSTIPTYAPGDVAAIEAASDEGWAYAKWPASVQALYREEMRSKRRQELRYLGWTGLVLCLACLGLDALGGMLHLGLLLRLGLVTPAYLIGYRLAGSRSTAWQFCSATFPVVVFAGAVAYLGVQAPDPLGDRYFMAAGMLIGFSVLAIPFGFRGLLTFTALCLLTITMVVILLAPEGIEVGRDVESFLAFSSGAPLMVARRTNRLKERNFLLALRSRIAQEEVLRVNDDLRRLSEHDPLTGLLNRRSFERRFDEAFETSVRTGATVAVLMIDLDRFKSLNDAFGHAAGDECLRGVSAVIERETTGQHGIVARYGGEEFVAAFFGPSGARAVRVAERIRRVIEGGRFDIGVAEPIAVSASIGVAASHAGLVGRNELVKRADAALYEAKHAGRNRVALFAAAEAPAIVDVVVRPDGGAGDVTAEAMPAAMPKPLGRAA